MLKLAKTESKKEMSLKKRKKANNKLYNNRNLTDRNNFYQNYNSSRCRKGHQILCEEEKINKPNNPNNSISDNKMNKKITHKQNSVFILRNNNYNNNFNLSSNNTNNNINNNISSIPISPSPKNKKVVYTKKNYINLKKCNSVRNINNVRNGNKYINNSLNRGLDYKIDKIVETEKEKMLKSIEDGKTRKLFSMASDIFNLDNTSTNLIANSKISPKTPNYLGNTNKKDIRNLLNNDNYYNILSNNILGIGRPKKATKFNRINFFNRNEYNKSDIKSINSKVNISNIESVKYDIISTQKSNIYDKYNNLSNIKATPFKVEDYEILIPKNYNKSNAYNLKSELNSNGLHIFGVKEEGDVIGGIKGKYKIKVRVNGQSEKDKNKMINKASNRLMNLDAKFKRNIIDWGKKKTDITGFGWDEEIKNGLY